MCECVSEGVFGIGLCVCVYEWGSVSVCVSLCVHMCAEVRGEFSAVSSLLLPHGAQVTGSGVSILPHWAIWKVWWLVLEEKQFSVIHLILLRYILLCSPGSFLSTAGGGIFFFLIFYFYFSESQYTAWGVHISPSASDSKCWRLLAWVNTTSYFLIFFKRASCSTSWCPLLWIKVLLNPDLSLSFEPYFPFGLPSTPSWCFRYFKWSLLKHNFTHLFMWVAF